MEARDTHFVRGLRFALAIAASCIAIALFAAASPAEASCVRHESDSDGNNFMRNGCSSKVIGKFCWDSRESPCSCPRRDACGFGPLSAGRKEVITGPRRDGYTRIVYRWCDYDAWVKDDCVLKDPWAYSTMPEPGKDSAPRAPRQVERFEKSR